MATQPSDDWIEWKGGECPVDSYSRVLIRTRGLGETPAHDACDAGVYSLSGDWWKHDEIGGSHDTDIVAYRVVRA